MLHHALRLLKQVVVYVHAAAQAHTMVWPRRPLGLQVEANLVGRLERRLGRTERVEAHHVEPVLLAFAEHPEPRSLVGWRISRQREAAVLYRSAHPDGAAANLNLAHSEVGLHGVGAEHRRQRVQVGLKLVPQLYIVSHGQRHPDGPVGPGHKPLVLKVAPGHVELNVVFAFAAHYLKHHVDGLGVDVGVNLYVADVHLGPRLQLHAAHNAVPVALRLVGHTVRVLPHAHILYAVVHLDGNVVVAPRGHVVGHIEHVRHAERRVAAHLPAIDEHRGLYVRALKIEQQALLAPRLWHADPTAVPRIAHVVLVRSEEKGELHLARLAVFGHVRVEEKRRIVEAAHPFRLDGHLVSLAIGEHRAGQCHPVVVVGGIALHEIPFSRQVDFVLRMGRHGRKHKQD